MSRVWTYMTESGLVRTVIALTMTMVLAYLVVAGREVPDALVAVTSATLGYYFATQQARPAGQGR